LNISLKINNLIATSCIGFLSLVYAYGYGLFLFGEKLGFVDVLASFIIFGFNIYSIVCPEPQETSISNENRNNNAYGNKSTCNRVNNGDDKNNGKDSITDNKVNKSST